MKVLCFVASVCFLLLHSCGGNDAAKLQKEVAGLSKQEGSKPVITFERATFDFGHMVAGERVTYSFRFHNTGDSPLVINAVKSGCGCTVGDYPKEPILPSQSGRIKVDFNSSGRNGKQTQSVSVVTNADPSTYQLTVFADVTK